MTRWPVRPHAPRSDIPGNRPLETDKTHVDATRPSKVSVDAIANVEMHGKV